MQLEPLDPYDDEAIAEVLGLHVDVHAADQAELFPSPTFWRFSAGLRHGPMGDPDRRWLLRSDAGEVIGDLMMRFPQRDNQHQALAVAVVHPKHRRSGHGTRLIEAGVELAREAERRSLVGFATESPRHHAFAEKLGFDLAYTDVQRRLDLTTLGRAELDRLHTYASEAAADYELLRVAGPMPEDLVDAVAEMASAINDAPRDDLDEEDEVFDAERIRSLERFQAACMRRAYDVIARHRRTGQLAGHTVVEVDSFRPQWGWQGDTSVVGAHRGHRLGLLLKSEMLHWLGEVEPELRSITTGNAQSNKHMIAVNEQLGYQVLCRTMLYQKAIPAGR